MNLANTFECGSEFFPDELWIHFRKVTTLIAAWETLK
jgi:hypothetical protein